MAYRRPYDNLPIEVIGNSDKTLVPGEEYKAITRNIGYGAYAPDSGFFME